MNDNHYHGDNKNDNKNDNENDYYGMNVSVNHFHLADKCVRDYGGAMAMVWDSIGLIINHSHHKS